MAFQGYILKLTLETLFCGFPGYKPVPPGWFKIVCWFYVGNTQRRTESGFIFFVAVFLGCTSTGRVGLCFLWFFVQELPKAQLAVVLVLKRLRRRGNGLKSHPTDWKPGIEPATPGLQDIGLSPTPRRLRKWFNGTILKLSETYMGTANNI